MRVPSSSPSPIPIKPAGISKSQANGQASGIAKPQNLSGMRMDQLNSMLQTSAKIQSIRKDPTISESVRRAMLKPLEEANKDAMTQAAVQAEKDDKAKKVAASNDDSEKIRKAGDDIAKAGGADGSSPPVAVENASGAADTAAPSPAFSPAAAAPSSPAAAYVAPAAAPAGATKVDTYA